MLTPEQLRQLTEFSSSRYLLSTFYYRAPKSASRAHHEEAIAVKDLFQEARRDWETRKLKPGQAASLEKDLEKALAYLRPGKTGGIRPVALFSCAGENFWEAVPLPHGIPSAAFVGETFSVQPLAALLEQYARYCLVLVDREKARLFEVHGEEMEERPQILDEVPPRVRAAGYHGYDERHIERHIEDHVHQHYKRVAGRVGDLFQRYGFHALVLGGHRDNLPEFEKHLAENVRQRVTGRFFLDVAAASLEEIRGRVLELIREHERREKESLLRRILDNAGPKGLAVTGLEATLEALHRGEVRALVVGEGLAVAGKQCRECGALALPSDECCRQCQGLLRLVDDIVEHAVQYAIRRNSQVRFVNSHEEFRRAGNIAALLRFRSRMVAE